MGVTDVQDSWSLFDGVSFPVWLFGVCALGWGDWGRREDSDSEKSMNNKVFQTFCLMSVAFVVMSQCGSCQSMCSDDVDNFLLDVGWLFVWFFELTALVSWSRKFSWPHPPATRWLNGHIIQCDGRTFGLGIDPTNSRLIHEPFIISATAWGCRWT